MTRRQKLLLMALLILPALLFGLALLSLPFIFGMALLLAFTGGGAAASGLFYLGQIFAVIPASAYNLLATALAVSFIPNKKTRYLSFLPLSFLLATAIEAPALWHRITHPPQIEQVVIRPIQRDRATYFQTGYGRYPGESLPIANPLEGLIGIGWDEGCMCIYWTMIDPYVTRLARDASYVLGEQRPLGKPLHAIAATITGTANQTDPRLLDINIELHDGNDVTARLTERGVPALQGAKGRAKRGELFNSNFVRNALTFVSHDTFWAPIIGGVFGYYPRAEIRAFLNAAISRPE